MNGERAAITRMNALHTLARLYFSRTADAFTATAAALRANGRSVEDVLANDMVRSREGLIARHSRFIYVLISPASQGGAQVEIG